MQIVVLLLYVDILSDATVAGGAEHDVNRAGLTWQDPDGGELNKVMVTQG